MKLSAVGKLGGLAALDKNLEDLDVVRPCVLPTGLLLRFEACSFNLLLGGDTAVDDAVHGMKSVNCYLGLPKGGADVYILWRRWESVKSRVGAARGLGPVARPAQIDIEQQFGHRVHLAAKLAKLRVTVAVRR